jgi:OOP family OmpA-OmpF porin
MNKQIGNWARVGTIALASLSVGCAEYEVRKLDAMAPTGSEFTKALSGQYKEFAVNEIREFYDDTSAEHFAIKGQQAAAGENVMPEDPANWDLPVKLMPELMAQHERLVSALKCKGRDLAPTFAAMAQRDYDEWVENLEERWQYELIDTARLDYYEHIRKVEEIICPLHKAPQFHVYFKTNSTQLDTAAKNVLEKAYESANENCHCDVFLIGYTDASGAHSHNVDLSKRRADSVKTELSGKGVEEHRLKAHGFGEMPHSARHERRNRTVEIILH